MGRKLRLAQKMDGSVRVGSTLANRVDLGVTAEPAKCVSFLHCWPLMV